MDGGRGFSSLTRGGSKGAVVRGRFVLLSPILPSSLYFSIGIKFSLIILVFYLVSFFVCFSGIRLTKKSQLTKGGGMKAGGESTAVRNRGVGKMWEAVAGSEAEGLYGLLRGVTSHSHLLPSQPPPKKPCHAPSITTSQPPPQESTGPKVSDPAVQATGPASPAALSALEEAIPAHMQPLQIQVGGIKWVYKCWVEGYK